MAAASKVVSMIFAVALCLQTNLTRFEFTQVHMGTPFVLTLYAPSASKASDIAQSVYARLRSLDETLSDYQQNSELNTVLKSAWKRPTACGEDLVFMLRQSIRVAKLTQSAFDPTVGPLVQVWRTARKTGILPSVSVIEEAKRSVGIDGIRLSPNMRTLFVFPRTVRIDFGGIAKGYACDEAIRICRQGGISDALIEGGGDLKASGTPPGEKGWNVTIQGSNQKFLLKDQAVSTSGSTEQFVEIGGVRYSHIVDPRTGYGLTHLRQCTVVAKEGLLTDPLATAGCVEPDSLKSIQGIQVFFNQR